MQKENLSRQIIRRPLWSQWPESSCDLPKKVGRFIASFRHVATLTHVRFASGCIVLLMQLWLLKKLKSSCHVLTASRTHSHTGSRLKRSVYHSLQAKPSDQIDGPDSMTPAEPKPCMEARLEGSIPDSSEVAVGSKDAAASEDSQQKGQEVISKPEDSSQESEPEPGSIMQCDALEPLLVEGRPEAEHVRRSDVSKGLEVENEKDLLPAVGKEALEDDVETKNSAQDGEYSRAAGKDNVGGLVQELLLAEASGATAGAGAHRGLVKKTHIGQKGREDRLKRAAEKGTVERSTLLAEKRGGGFQVSEAVMK